MSDRQELTRAPKSVVRATALVVISTMVSALSLDYSTMSATAAANNAPLAEVIAGLVFGFALILLFAYLSLRGRNWARIMLLLMFLGSFLPPFGNGIQPYLAAFQQSIVVGTLALFITATWAAAMVIYFLPESSAWYRSVRESRNGPRNTLSGD